MHSQRVDEMMMKIAQKNYEAKKPFREANDKLIRKIAIGIADNQEIFKMVLLQAVNEYKTHHAWNFLQLFGKQRATNLKRLLEEKKSLADIFPHLSKTIQAGNEEDFSLKTLLYKKIVAHFLTPEENQTLLENLAKMSRTQVTISPLLFTKENSTYPRDFLPNLLSKLEPLLDKAITQETLTTLGTNIPPPIINSVTDYFSDENVENLNQTENETTTSARRVR